MRAVHRYVAAACLGPNLDRISKLGRQDVRSAPPGTPAADHKLTRVGRHEARPAEGSGGHGVARLPQACEDRRNATETRARWAGAQVARWSEPATEILIGPTIIGTRLACFSGRCPRFGRSTGRADMTRAERGCSARAWVKTASGDGRCASRLPRRAAVGRPCVTAAWAGQSIGLARGGGGGR